MYFYLFYPLTLHQQQEIKINVYMIYQIRFSVKPDNVTLERNTTENNGCTDMWVNFTCKSSEANPPVYNYVLLRNETRVGLSEKGTWIQKISRGETFVYKCQAYQQVENVTSTNNFSLSVKGKIQTILVGLCNIVNPFVTTICKGTVKIIVLHKTGCLPKICAD